MRKERGMIKQNIINQNANKLNITSAIMAAKFGALNTTAYKIKFPRFTQVPASPSSSSHYDSLKILISNKRLTMAN